MRTTRVACVCKTHKKVKMTLAAQRDILKIIKKNSKLQSVTMLGDRETKMIQFLYYFHMDSVNKIQDRKGYKQDS